MAAGTWMGRAVPWVIGAVVAAGVGAGAGWYFWEQQQAPPPVPAPVAVAPSVPAAPVEPEVHYPIPAIAQAQPAARPLPGLDESDPVARDALSLLVGLEAVKKFFVPDELIRHIVVTVDNLPRKSFALRLSPIRPVGGMLSTSGKDDGLAIAPGNAARYTPCVRMMQAINAKRLVAAYVALYPLFQRAYEDLGYPEGHFNDRLVAVIDHLRAAPEVQGPVALVTPHVQSQFADPGLEALSAGQKIMVRIGAGNAAAVKAKLGEIRHELTSLTARQ